MNMKTLRFLGMALVATVLSAGFCACSDDDDASSPSSDGAIIKTDDGAQLLLSSIKYGSSTEYKFTYDEEGRCTYVYGDCYDYDISYNPYKIICDDEDQDEMKLNFSFNGSGYVTKISGSWSSKGTNWEDSGTCTINISYDGDHPTKITESYSGKETDEEDKYSWSGSVTATLTWKNDNMTKMNYTWKETDSDGDNWSETGSYTYDYGNTSNEYKQHTLALNKAYWEIDFMEDLGFIGYFGKGTSNLPTSCEVEYTEEDGYEYSKSYSCSYTKNSNGTINTEKSNNTTYTYSYTSLDASTRSAVATPFDDMFISSEKADVQKRMFGRHSRHEKAK